MKNAPLHFGERGEREYGICKCICTCILIYVHMHLDVYEKRTFGERGERLIFLKFCVLLVCGGYNGLHTLRRRHELEHPLDDLFRDTI